MEKKIDWKKIGANVLAHGEDYIGTVIFVFMTILLTVQVVSRYLFNHSFTWTEELSVVMFVWLIYLGVSGAVTKRKHLRIDALINVLPFKAKKFLLTLDNVIMFLFCLGIIPAIMNIINNFADKSAVTSLLRMPKAVVYGIIPFGMVLTCIRLVQDTVRLFKEDEKTLGKSKPTIDIDALEQEYLDSLKKQQKMKGDE